jgi:hypothetical protein
LLDSALETCSLQKKKKGTPSPEAKKQAHPARSAAGHAGLSGDAAAFFLELHFTTGP